jgi:hypothetical protein
MEAYGKIYEASEETGAITKPVSSDAAGASSAATATVPTDNAQATKVSLSNSDATKILKGISDIYLKTKDITTILQKNNVPGLAASLEAEKAKLAQTVNTVLMSTPGVKDTRTRNSMLAGLDPDIVKIANAPTATQPPADATQPPAPAPAAPAVPAALGKTDNQPAQVTTAGIPAAGTEEPVGQPAPSAPTTTAVAAPANSVQPPVAQEGPYYVMTTKGPRLATKGTPGAYQINRLATNK